MSQRSQHLSDQELLQFIDSELPANRLERFQEHMAICTRCQERRTSIEGTLNFLDEHASERFNFSSTAAQSRTLLRGKLAEGGKSHRFWRWSSAGIHLRLPIAVALAIILIAFAVHGGRRAWETRRFLSSAHNEAIIPSRSLTPGAVRTVTLEDICSSSDADLDPTVSISMTKAVLREYGIPSSAPVREYQIDYLVNPQLGGTSDIKNLWPEPYSSARWNAQAKDELERRLHQKVCDHTVDLAAAQREIETDWIAAYQKYVGRNG